MPAFSSRFRGVYPILDLDALERAQLEPLAVAGQLLTATPAALQLRGKHASARRLLQLLGDLKPLCAAAGVPLFVNDRPDLALIAGVDGVHLGQEDMTCDELRQLVALAPGGGMGKRLRVGISTHNQAQLGAALLERPDYVAFGPVFVTRSKLDPDPELGLDELSRAHQACLAAGVALVAIGGVCRSNADAVSCRADVGAVIGDLLSGGLSQVAQRARDLQQAFSRERSRSR